MSYSYISSEAKKVPNADPAHPPPELLFRRASAPLLARLWELSRRGRGVPPKSAAAQCAADLHVAATRACVYARVRACAVRAA